MVKDCSNMNKQILKQLEKYNNVQGLMQYINVDTLYQKHRNLNGKKATGIDKVTKEKYNEEIISNLTNLIDRMKKHKYMPQPARRVEIPKPNGKTRPLGIPSYEDKIVQAQMAEILNIIFERYFKDFSYGFRPNKDCHKAIKKLDETIMHGKVKWIVEADIKGFFDNVNHDILLRMLKVVIKDRDFIELIRKFLKSGYMKNDVLYDTNKGTPQGGIISPILANVYLHIVLDKWFDEKFRKLCKGEIYIIRYADDFVTMFQYESDARMFYNMIRGRFMQFGLELEETKTKIFPFGRYANENKKYKSQEFDFLGFTISNGLTREGYYKVNYRTSKKKSSIKYKEMLDFIKKSRTTKPKSLIKSVNKRLVGIYNYYGISGNINWLIKFANFVRSQIKKWLSRRSQRGKLSWDKFKRIVKYNPIVKPKISLKLW